MSEIDPRTPVLIGAGQIVRHWSPGEGDAPSPSSLRAEAAAAALADCGVDGIAQAIDTVVVVRTMLDSIPGTPQPFGRSENPPGALAAALGLSPARSIYSAVGGDQPQTLVNEFAERIHAGEVRTVLIAGAEATAAMKAAAKARLKLDWTDKAVAGPAIEDRGLGPRLLSDYELANGFGAPTQSYPIFEQALRARLGHDRAAHRALMSELWARFSEVAAANPHAQFPTARTPDFLSTPSTENYAVADPYLKWDVAQDAVNQGAAVILTSVGEAARLGVPAARQVHLHGYAQLADRAPSERPDLSRSRAIELVLQRTLDAAGKTTAEIALWDLYSCFPVAVLLAAEAVGLDWRETVPTVTGGLPFFGGPGNNYSLHAIAEMVTRLRAAPEAFGLVLANGGFLSKEAAGIYSVQPRADWQPRSCDDLAATLAADPAPKLLAESGEAVVESWTVSWRKGKPQHGFVVARSDKGRIVARVPTGHRATLAWLSEADPIGQTLAFAHKGGRNLLVAPDPIEARRFRYVVVARRGHILDVTLNRPENLNALHSDAHFELHEIWDAFEADPELWVAVLTGAGDRAFCSGNDLKATAAGGDMTLPKSGFAGLCARFDREKPIVAAVNGIAMGGGLEIVLACDVAVADPAARFALPEVKVGLFAAAGGVQRLTRQIGRKAAMEMILTGRHVEAEEAAALGIVNRVTEPGGALAAAQALADQIAANSPTAIRASRQALNKLDEVDALKDALDANGPIIAALLRTEDFREGVTAFAQKRPPEWRNR